jgi:hypothetical protein
MEQSPSWEANFLQLVQKFSSFYGTHKFITALTSARHLSLSWANSIQSPQPSPTSRRSMLGDYVSKITPPLLIYISIVFVTHFFRI